MRLFVGIALLVLHVGACTEATGTGRADGCAGTVLGDVCAESPVGPSILGKLCKTHVDCLNLAACIGGTCQQQCTQPWQCPKGLTCDHFRCLDPTADAGVAEDAPASPEVFNDTHDATDGGPSDLAAPTDPGPSDVPQAKACQSAVDCAGLGACVDGHCKKECTTDPDCGDPTTWDCKQFTCFKVTPADVGPTDPGAPPKDDGPPPKDDGPELPLNCTAKKAGYAATCYCKQDCLSGLCLGDIAAGKGFCTEECTTSNDCPNKGWCYADASSGVKVCVKNDAGAPCAQGCLSNLTLESALKTCVCTVPCDSAAQCPIGMACAPIGGNPGKYCMPIGDICDPSASLNPCFGTCWPDVPPSTAWICTSDCTKLTDCPEGMICYQDIIQGQTFNHCLTKP